MAWLNKIMEIQNEIKTLIYILLMKDIIVLAEEDWLI